MSLNLKFTLIKRSTSQKSGVKTLTVPNSRVVKINLKIKKLLSSIGFYNTHCNN